MITIKKKNHFNHIFIFIYYDKFGFDLNLSDTPNTRFESKSAYCAQAECQEKMPTQPEKMWSNYESGKQQEKVRKNKMKGGKASSLVATFVLLR